MSEASLDAGNLTKGDPYPLKHAKSRLGVHRCQENSASQAVVSTGVWEEHQEFSGSRQNFKASTKWVWNQGEQATLEPGTGGQRGLSGASAMQLC